MLPVRQCNYSMSHGVTLHKCPLLHLRETEAKYLNLLGEDNSAVTAGNVVVRLPDRSIGGQDCTGNSWQYGGQATGLVNWWTGLHW